MTVFGSANYYKYLKVKILKNRSIFDEVIDN